MKKESNLKPENLTGSFSQIKERKKKEKKNPLHFHLSFDYDDFDETFNQPTTKLPISGIMAHIAVLPVYLRFGQSFLLEQLFTQTTITEIIRKMRIFE